MSDPRDSSLEVPSSLPKAWTKDIEGLSSLSMLMSGAVMVTRNRFLAWPAILIALSGYAGSRPLRQKDGGQGLSAIVFALAATMSAYLPMFFLPALQKTQTSLPTD